MRMCAHAVNRSVRLTNPRFSAVLSKASNSAFVIFV